MWSHRADHKDVARVWALPAYAKELQDVPELAVDVANNRDGPRDGLYVALLEQLRFYDSAQRPHLRLRERVALLDLREPSVQVDISAGSATAAAACTGISHCAEYSTRCQGAKEVAGCKVEDQIQVRSS